MQFAAIDKVVPSLCPICLQLVEARIFQDGKTVRITKICPDHGKFEDIYWSDADLYKKFDRYWDDGEGVENPHTRGDNCPFDCGICDNHKTGTLLANIDLTNRCNLSCPVCFANAEASGRVYEPTLVQIREMMIRLRELRPVPCPAVQFSGGEPTMREDLPSILAMARDMGFDQIQIATNGIRLAKSFNLCRALEKSGLNTVYLQFDGFTPKANIAFRGRDVLPLKLKAIENFRRSGIESVVLVPVLEKGVNDGEIGDIIRFAAGNLDVVRGLNFQPISFTGRANQAERLSRRITIPDFFHLVEEQTGGEITKDDFYPVSFVAPISRLVSAETGISRPVFSVHPHCGAATYVFHHNGHLIPISRFVDLEGLYELLNEEVEHFDGTLISRLKMHSRIVSELPKLIDESGAPEGLNFLRMFLGMLKNGTRDSLRVIHKNALFLGTMHFQDLYNVDLERVQRCGVHYATPDGRIIPFCAYNMIHREEVEEKFSVPVR
ncbi:MAG TPA: radical SAM protein [Methanotrichaceae archaeon]|nr:radical SAM protein [Methanotrichaceae archaeon]